MLSLHGLLKKHRGEGFMFRYAIVNTTINHTLRMVEGAGVL